MPAKKKVTTTKTIKKKIVKTKTVKKAAVKKTTTKKKTVTKKIISFLNLKFAIVFLCKRWFYMAS